MLFQQQIKKTCDLECTLITIHTGVVQSERLEQIRGSVGSSDSYTHYSHHPNPNYSFYIVLAETDELLVHRDRAINEGLCELGFLIQIQSLSGQTQSCTIIFPIPMILIKTCASLPHNYLALALPPGTLVINHPPANCDVIPRRALRKESLYIFYAFAYK